MVRTLRPHLGAGQTPELANLRGSAEAHAAVANEIEPGCVRASCSTARLNVLFLVFCGAQRMMFDRLGWCLTLTRRISPCPSASHATCLKNVQIDVELPHYQPYPELQFQGSCVETSNIRSLILLGKSWR